MSKAAKTAEGVIDALLPGREVTIAGIGDKVKVRVYPLGIRHFKKFRAAVGAIFGAIEGEDIGGVVSGTDEDRFNAMRAIVARVLPSVMDEGFDLLEACCRISPAEVTINDLPHWAIPDIAEAWLHESFSGEGLRPWQAALGKAFLKVTGKPLPDVKASILGTLSKLSSPPDTSAPTSSTDDSPASPTVDGLGHSSAISGSGQGDTPND